MKHKNFRKLFTIYFITLIFILITIGFAFGYVFSCRSAIKRRTNMLSELIERLNQAKEAKEAKEAKDHDPVNDITAYAAKEEHKDKFYELYAMWMQYKRHLIPGTDYCTASVDADEFFNVSNLTNGLSMGFWNNLGSVFTGLGILGTFVGLVIGMYNLDFSNGADTAASIKSLLDGTQTAFFTSIVGIFSSLFFNGYHESRLMKNFSRHVSELSIALDDAYPLLSVEQQMSTAKAQADMIAVMNSLLQESRRQTDSLCELREGVSTDLKETLETLQKDMSGAVAQALSSTVGNDFKPAIEQLTTTVKSLQEGGRKAIQKAMEKGARQALQDFANQVEKLNGDMQALLAQSVEAMDASTKSLAEMGKRTEQVNQEAAAMVEAMDQAAGRMSGSLQEAGDSMLSGMAEATGKMTAAAAPIRQAVENMQRGQEATGELIRKLDDTAQKLLESSAGMSETIKAANDFRTENQDSFEKLGQSIKNTSLALGNDIDQFNKNMRDGLTKNMQQYDQSIGAAMERLAILCEKLNAVCEDLTKAR